MALGTSDIALEGPLDSLVVTGPHLPLSPMAATICSGSFILRHWRMALTLPALLINSILNTLMLWQVAGCLQKSHN